MTMMMVVYRTLLVFMALEEEKYGIRIQVSALKSLQSRILHRGSNRAGRKRNGRQG